MTGRQEMMLIDVGGEQEERRDREVGVRLWEALGSRENAWMCSRGLLGNLPHHSCHSFSTPRVPGFLHTLFNLHIILTLGGKYYHPHVVGRKPRFGEVETVILTHTASQRTGARVDVTEKLGYLPPFQISFQASFFFSSAE